MSIFKKDLLFKMIEEGNIKSFTILGVPKQNLVETYFKRKDLIKFLEAKNIKCNILDEFDRTDIGIYFPQLGKKQYADACSITVSRTVGKEEFKNIINLFDEVLSYYPVDVPPRIINKIIGLYKDEPLTFNDMLLMTRDSQSEVARKIGKSRQLITDIKSGKSKLTVENLSALMRAYPLLPWNEFIETMEPTNDSK